MAPEARARVLVSHPGRQHSHQAALALHAADRLAGYWSGVPSRIEHARGVPPTLWRRFVRYAPLDLPASSVRWTPWVPALRRAGDALPRPLSARIDLLACRLFDRWVAHRLPQAPARAVLACEISAAATFAAARRLGWTTLLDAPALHHATQERLHGHAEPARVHRRIVAIKQAEIALADHVVTVSELARSSYLAAGVPADRVHAVSPGADLDLFAARRAAPTGRFRFVFGGATIQRKGFDVLAAAFEQAFRRGLEAELHVVGPRGDAWPAAARLPSDRLRFHGPLTQEAWARELSAADCLVLPSRSDSFGMVVVEALASGVPALVSDQVGAKEMISPGRNGFVLPAGDLEALAAELLRLAPMRSELFAMTPACRGAATAASWASYRGRFAELIERLVAA